MKKKFTSAVVAAIMVTATVLGSLTGIISASVIDKTGYPFANYKTVPVYDYSNTGADTTTIQGALGSSVKFADSEMHVFQTDSGKAAKFYQQTSAPAENNGMYITVKNTNDVDVVLGFMPYLGSSTLPKGVEWSKYYLINGDKYEEFEYGTDMNYTTITIPANYEGKLVVKFDSYLKSKNPISATDIAGFWIVLYDVTVNEEKYMIFDDFGFIGAEKEAGEIEESEYPYTASNRWDEFSFEEMPLYSTAGDIGEISVSNGKLVVSLNDTFANSGVKLPIETSYTGKYDAAYFRVNSDFVYSLISIIPQWTVGGKTCYIKEGGEYFVRHASDGSLYKKVMGSDKIINVSANDELIITVPYENIVIEDTTTAIPVDPVITEFAIVFPCDGVTGEPAAITLDDIGFVKKIENSFIIPPKMNGNVVSEADLNFTFTEEAKVLLDAANPVKKLEGCGEINGVPIDQRDVVLDETKGNGIPIYGNPKFEYTLSSTREFQGLVFTIDATEAEKDLNIRFLFTQGTAICHIGMGNSYYLINDADGLIYRYSQTQKAYEDGTVLIPKNFKGKVLVTFDSLISTNPEVSFDPSKDMAKVEICFVDLNGKAATADDFKYLWINDLKQVKDLNSIGDLAYKLDLKMINLDVSGRGLMNSNVSPKSGMDPTYWLYSHETDFVNSFTEDGAYEGTGERLTAVAPISNKNCWGVSYGGSWTCVNKNAIVYYVDATGAPNLSYKPLLFPQTMKSYDLTDKNGNPILKRDGTPKTARYAMGRWTVTSESKIFLVNENSVRNGHPKAKLASISGNNMVLNGFKGFVVIPFLEMKPDGSAVGDAYTKELVTLKDISLVTGVSMQFMMGGMTKGEYVTFDYSGLAYVECPGVIDTWNPSGTGAPEEEVGPPTGVNRTAAVATAAVLGTSALGFGGYNIVSKKRKANRAEKRGER